MAYQRSTLISRSGYSGLGADPYVNKDIIDAYRSAKPFGDISLTDPAMLAVGAAAVWFLFLRKKR